jgi:hypothetical protein
VEAEPRRGRGRRGLLAVVLLCALLAAALRAAALIDDPWANGYDGWYYVLQVRSLVDGAPLFADRSLVFVPLVALARLTGDAILGNQLAACLFAAVAAAGGALAGWRWTGRLSAAAVAGGWWALSPLHLGVSAEFLKNSAGVAVLSLLLAALPRCERRRGLLAAAISLALLGPLVHKLTGVLGLLAAVGYTAARLLGGRRPPRWLWGVVGLGLLAVAAGGLLRPSDFLRLLGGEGGHTTRLAAFNSTRLINAERVELILVHVAPLALLAGLWQRRHRAACFALLPLSLAALAPGLPFGWDLTAWRLLLMGFISTGLIAAIGVSSLGRARWPAVAVLLSLGLWQAPSIVRATQARSPDYSAWATAIPVLRATIPPNSRVIAHRGLCGFVWAEAGIICENFQPSPPHDRWWRIAYGFGPERFVPYVQGGDPAPVVAIPGYTIVWEPHWQRFLVEEGENFRLAYDPRNPFRVRPAFVYGPGQETPAPQNR